MTAAPIVTLLCLRCDMPFRARRILHHCPPCTLAAAAVMRTRPSMYRRTLNA